MKVTTTTLSLSSSAFQPNGPIPAKYTCDGENMSPPISIAGVPKNAQSLTLIVHDPDAPRGNWDHWIVWNIKPNTTTIEEGTVPDGAVEGTNDFKQQAYGGPCPPSGTHRYVFALYALDRELQLASGSQRQELEKAMQGHILDQAELIGTYKSQK